MGTKGIIKPKKKCAKIHTRGKDDKKLKCEAKSPTLSEK